VKADLVTGGLVCSAAFGEVTGPGVFAAFAAAPSGADAPLSSSLAGLLLLAGALEVARLRDDDLAAIVFAVLRTGFLAAVDFVVVFVAIRLP
jgi:hypothetical protein